MGKQRLGLSSVCIKQFIERIEGAAVGMHYIIKLGLASKTNDANILAGTDHCGHFGFPLLGRPIEDVDIGIDLFLQIFIDRVINHLIVRHRV